MMIVVSVVLGILPLLGIVWTFLTGTIKTVDGLFITLILFTLSGVFFLNAWWECRDCGYLDFIKKKPKQEPPKQEPTKKG